MANVIKHKRGSGSDPVASDLVVGEVAIRTDVGKLFTKMDNGSVAEIAGGGSDIAINTLSSSSATGGGSATFNGSAYRFTLSAPPSVSAQQLLVSINGVIQKPVAGTGQPSEGFSVDGTDIILGDAPAAGSDFFILTFKSLGVSEPADNSVTSAKIADGAIVNADINASAAIAGTKISPNFGSQNTTTTGISAVGELQITSTAPKILFIDSDTDPDYELRNMNGVFRLRDSTNDIIRITQTGSITDIAGHLDVGAGLDVTGAITGTAAITLGNGSGLNWGDTSARIRGESGASGLLRFDTNSSERMRINSSGNVGIGLTTPGHLLHLMKAMSSSPNLIEISTSGTNTVGGGGGISFDTSASNTNATAFRAQIHGVRNSLNNGSNDLVFLTTTDDVSSSNPTEKVRIKNDGKVGIGTASPSHPLDVEVSSGDAVTRIHAAENNSLSEARLRLEVSNDFAESVVEAYDSSGIGGSLKYNHGDNAWRFTTNNDNERMRITSTGLVGIGTTSPSSLLHISDTQSSGGVGLTLTNIGDGGSSTTPFCSIDAKLNLIRNGGQIRFGREGVYGDQASADSFMAFYTAQNDTNTERMRIDSSGRLLLGTNNARTDFYGSLDADLQVEGSNYAAYSVYTTNGNGAFIFGAGGRTNNSAVGNISWMSDDGTDEVECARIGVQIDGTPGSNDMPGRIIFSTTADGSSSVTERMRIDNSGNVGIGTTSPSVKLHVNGGSGLLVERSAGTSVAGFKHTGATAMNIYFENSGSTNHPSIGSNNEDLTLATNNNERIRIKQNGRVDFGGLTNNAIGVAALRVKHYSTSNNPVNIIGAVSGNGYNNVFIGGNDTSFTGTAATTVRFYTGGATTANGTERMRIDSSGHILGSGMTSLTANTNVSGFNFSFQSDHGRLNLHAKGTAATPTLVEAFYHSANHVGGIRLTSSSTAYGTTSDYRLKENAIPISDGITRLKTLKPYRFNFKIEPDKTVDGFFAHEVTAVPEAITGTKDEIFTEDDDTRGAKAGDPKYQEIDQSKLVPLLVAALQEAIGRIEALEAK